jgi:leucine dehydrogenase
MEFFQQLSARDYEQIIAFNNNATGLRGFLAFHDTTLGPALGGVRIWRYATDADALNDALRLSRGMTYKASLAGLPCGGAKTVVMLHDGMRREEAFAGLGCMIESFAGRYFCARDVGITDADLAAIATTTRYVAKEPSPELGEISEHTAIGVWQGMRACLAFAGISGKIRVAIQGVGSVGHVLARIVKREAGSVKGIEGVELLLADVDESRAAAVARELGAKVIPPDEILSVNCDVLAPCALGGVISPESAARIKARIVCGSANNILTGPDAADAIAKRNIIYAPDYLVNAGGLIRGAEYFLLGIADSHPSLMKIHERTQHVLNLSLERGVSPAIIADELAEARLVRPKRFNNLTWHASRLPSPEPQNQH